MLAFGSASPWSVYSEFHTAAFPASIVSDMAYSTIATETDINGSNRTGVWMRRLQAQIRHLLIGFNATITKYTAFVTSGTSMAVSLDRGQSVSKNPQVETQARSIEKRTDTRVRWVSRSSRSVREKLLQRFTSDCINYVW